MSTVNVSACRTCIFLIAHLAPESTLATSTTLRRHESTNGNYTAASPRMHHQHACIHSPIVPHLPRLPLPRHRSSSNWSMTWARIRGVASPCYDHVPYTEVVGSYYLCANTRNAKRRSALPTLSRANNVGRLAVNLSITTRPGHLLASDSDD